MINMNMQEYPLNVNYWERFLKRNLNKKEKYLIKNVYIENHMNEIIKSIYNRAVEDGLYIPVLTKNDGNCLFSSLCYYKFADNINTLKNGISNMLLYFRDMKNFLPKQELSLAELFSAHNDIEYAFCYKEQKLYKYDFNAMCLDITTSDGWKRINTELLFNVLSIVMNLKFKIYHDNGHITTIFSKDQTDDNTKEIYLAQLGESHYIPLDKLPCNTIPNCLEYSECYDEFAKWGKKVKMDAVISERNYSMNYHRNFQRNQMNMNQMNMNGNKKNAVQNGSDSDDYPVYIDDYNLDDE
jgi:hypothetical protein